MNMRGHLGVAEEKWSGACTEGGKGVPVSLGPVWTSLLAVHKLCDSIADASSVLAAYNVAYKLSPST